MRSNCFVVAWRAFWLAMDAPKGQETYLCLRLSRSRPRYVGHALWGKYDPGIHAIRVQSFKPIRPVNLPWWRAWRRFRFEGRIVEGDTHAPTEPPRG